MSDVVSAADDGASVAPVDNADAEKTVEQEGAQDSTTEQVDEGQKEEKARDEKGRFVPQERVNEITRARREAERQVEALRRELDGFRSQQPPQNQAQSKSAPKPEDFDWDLSAFGAALTEYAVSQAQTQAEARLQQRAQQERTQQAHRSFDERAAKFSADNPDFDESMSSLASTVRFHPDVVETISLSEQGPAVIHYLAKHLDEADDIARMPSHLAAAHIGRIEARLATAKPKPVTNAPKPPPTLGGGAAASKDPDRMTADEGLAWRRKQL